MHRRAQMTCAMAVAFVLFEPGCFSSYSSCAEDSARCFEGLGALGGFGGASTGGKRHAGGAAATQGTTGGDGGGAGHGGEPAAPDGPIATLGEECASEGALACSGNASRFPLVCESGEWTSAGQCSWDERCVTEGVAAGTCQPVLPECLDHEPGDWVCDGGDKRFRCGADLIDKVDREECLGCDAGTCWECEPRVTAASCSNNSVVTCSEAGTLVFTACPASQPHCSAGVCGFPPSCPPGPSPCVLPGGECCASPVVLAGAFDQNNNAERPATISAFRLDQSEVSNGRFRNFRQAWGNGWRPAAGSGKHTHLRDGAGLMTTDDTFESGWNTEWAVNVDLTDMIRSHDSDPYATWSGPTNFSFPVNFVNFYEAYAFCIWDGGFLPSAAEWSYAASGGEEQRELPWGSDAPGKESRFAAYGCWYGTSDGICVSATNIASVDPATRAISLFGQLDLAGNVAERVLGGLTLPGTCNDCLELAAPPLAPTDQVRGGAFDSDASALRNDATPPSVARSTRSAQIGFRCARPP